MNRPVYFVQIKVTKNDTWLDSRWQDQIIPVVVTDVYRDRAHFRPYTDDFPMAPFFIPFNACISSEYCIPCTEEQAMAKALADTGHKPEHIEAYDPTPLTQLYPHNAWYKED